MRLKEMTAALQATQEMLSRWGASASVSKDLQRLIDLMSRDDELSVAQFCAKVEKALEAEGGRQPSGSRAKGPDKELADDYIDKIRSPQITRPDFIEIIGQLKKDKNCRLQELDYIANALTRAGRKYRSKKDAIEDIERYGHRRLDVGRRMEDTSSVF